MPNISGKRVALLNMCYDNNYGGNLQRYALSTVLQRMGYDVEYLYIRENWDDWFTCRSKKTIVKSLAKQVARHICHPLHEPLLAYHVESERYQRLCAVTEPFLDKYIKHTKPIYASWELKRHFINGNYDVVLAGSDQIWRKQFVGRYGIGTWFFGLVPEGFQGKRVVYGASFGVSEKEYERKDLDTIKPLFRQIDAVSVRESSGIELLNEYGLSDPGAKLVLDPTLLLTKEDYLLLIEAADTKPLNGTMFCYVLDRTEDKMRQIETIATERNIVPVVRTISDEPYLSVEQWLRNIWDAEFVFTDSYHGLIFSLIFEKPYYLVMNQFRGNSRFESLLNILHIQSHSEPVWSELRTEIDKRRVDSINFIERALA